MTLLAILGAVLTTIILIWLTLGYLSIFILSDETVWFALKSYPVQMSIWLLLGVVLAGLWWVWVSHLMNTITITIG